MDTIHGYHPWILSMDIMHGYYPWIISMDNIRPDIRLDIWSDIRPDIWPDIPLDIRPDIQPDIRRTSGQTSGQTSRHPAGHPAGHLAGLSLACCCWGGGGGRPPSLEHACGCWPWSPMSAMVGQSQAALRIIAGHLSDQEASNSRKLFLYLDKDGDGNLVPEELEEMIFWMYSI